MRQLFAILVAVAGFSAMTSGPVSEQQLIATYYAELSGQDLFNSRGQRLQNFCAIVQQDRANFHRFGRAQPADQYDPVFGNRDARAQISQVCRLAGGSEYIPSMIAQYGMRYVRVQVFGQNGWPTLVLVSEGAG